MLESLEREVADVIDQLLTGQMTRERAANWAMDIYGADDFDDDPLLDDALNCLCGMALPETDDDSNRIGYLFGTDELADCGDQLWRRIRRRRLTLLEEVSDET